MTDRELWTCANEMRKQFGNDAQIEAAKRCDAMFEVDDRQGYATWAQILIYVSKLGPVVDPQAIKH